MLPAILHFRDQVLAFDSKSSRDQEFVHPCFRRKMSNQQKLVKTFKENQNKFLKDR